MRIKNIKKNTQTPPLNNNQKLKKLINFILINLKNHKSLKLRNKNIKRNLIPCAESTPLVNELVTSLFVSDVCKSGQDEWHNFTDDGRPLVNAHPLAVF